MYYDGQQNDARMNVMLVLSAVREGAAASNYIQVHTLLLLCLSDQVIN